MNIIDNVLIVSLIIGAFIAGVRLDNYYQTKAAKALKDALQQQYVRLRAGSDADDPLKPYLGPTAGAKITRMPANFIRPDLHPYSGDSDGDDPIPELAEKPKPITSEFMDNLKTTGQASVRFRKSDIAK